MTCIRRNGCSPLAIHLALRTRSHLFLFHLPPDLPGPSLHFHVGPGATCFIGGESENPFEKIYDGKQEAIEPKHVCRR